MEPAEHLKSRADGASSLYRVDENSPNPKCGSFYGCVGPPAALDKVVAMPIHLVVRFRSCELFAVPDPRVLAGTTRLIPRTPHFGQGNVTTARFSSEQDGTE